MTYRERREARADRLEAWATQRQERAAATLAADDALPYAHDWAFITQPGRIPERDRLNRREAAAFASMDKADAMASRAEEIRRQADHAIYSDDEDAPDRLRARIAQLEAQREERTAANAAYRKAHRAELAAMTPYERSQAAPWPSYSLSNLSGNISRQRARLHALEHPRPTWFRASRRDPETCYKCDRQRDQHTPHPAAPSVLMCPAVVR